MKIALLVAYDGTGFRGVARQRGRAERTVQGELEGRLGVLLRAEVTTAVAGRTDAGVHAGGQVLTFDIDRDVDVEWLRRRLNKWLAPEVSVRAAAVVGGAFDARHSAKRRVYEYVLYGGDAPDPFLDRFAVHVGQPLDVRAMRAAARAFVGEHDFASYCRAGEGTTVRRVRRIAITRDDPRIVVRVEGDAFCQQMVRSIVGTLLQVGRGERDPGEIPKIIAARDRAAAGPVAPAKGLTLVSVRYARDPFRFAPAPVPAPALPARRSRRGTGGS